MKVSQINNNWIQDRLIFLKFTEVDKDREVLKLVKTKWNLTKRHWLKQLFVMRPILRDLRKIL